MKNGSVFSPSNWAENEDMETTMTAMECATEAQIKSCFDGSLDENDGGSSQGRRKKRSSSSNGQNMAMYLPTAKFLAKELEDWVQVKKFDDGFDTLRSTECEIPKDDTTCGCECDKVNKVQTGIYSMIILISLFKCSGESSQDVQDIEHFGQFQNPAAWRRFGVVLQGFPQGGQSRHGKVKDFLSGRVGNDLRGVPQR